MKQLTEDYCSYEIAKLLKEKGFVGNGDIGCKCGFYSQNTDYPNQIDLVYDDLDNSELEHNECLRPTQSIVLKWLREVHNLHIEIYRTACGYLYIISNIPYGTDLYNPEYGGDDKNSGQWTTYEKVVEAAIKYTLENLI